jgi:hypothetical protein
LADISVTNKSITDGWIRHKPMTKLLTAMAVTNQWRIQKKIFPTPYAQWLDLFFLSLSVKNTTHTHFTFLSKKHNTHTLKNTTHTRRRTKQRRNWICLQTSKSILKSFFLVLSSFFLHNTTFSYFNFCTQTSKSLRFQIENKGFKFGFVFSDSCVSNLKIKKVEICLFCFQICVSRNCYQIFYSNLHHL